MRITSVMKFVFCFLSVTLYVTSCTQDKLNCDSFTFTFEYFVKSNTKTKTSVNDDGISVVRRFYPEKFLKDVCFFHKNGNIQKYVFIIEGTNEPRLILYYDSLCSNLPSSEGHIGFFVSNALFDTLTLNEPYTVDYLCATPPKMVAHTDFYFSSDKSSWEYFNSKSFRDDFDGSVIVDTVSLEHKHCMVTCKLTTSDSLYVVLYDTVYYNLNIQNN